MLESSAAPFFIVGNPRSGTTLLRFILSSHPKIYIPGETGFLPFLPFDVDEELQPEQVRSLLDHIGKLNRSWYGLVSDLSSFYQSLPEPTLPYLLDALYRRRIAEHDAARWGDKTPSYVRYIPLLSQIFPSAQFIHVIRDGRDATLSARKKWGARRWYMDNYYLLKNWVRNVEAGRRAGQALEQGRYLEVHYEHLVETPRPELKRVCAFLKEQLHPAMLDHTQLAQEQIGPRGHVEVRQEISTRSVQRWRREMSPFDRKLADRVAGPTLAALGYEPSSTGAMTPIEATRYAFLAAKYAVTNTAREALLASGVLTLNRGKRR